LSTVYGVAMGLRHAVPSKPYTKKVWRLSLTIPRW
jgi:hypothetical protein